MRYHGYTTEEVGRRGQALYDQKIRDKVEAKHQGRFLVVDITTGEYEIDDSDLVASKRAMTKNPDAALYGVRVGYPAAYRLGLGSTDPVPPPLADDFPEIGGCYKLSRSRLRRA